MTFRGMTSDHLARYQAGTLASWPRARLAPAQLPVSWQLPPFSPWPDALILLLAAWFAAGFLAAWPAGRAAWGCSPAPRCPGTHLVFGISSRQMGQNGPFTFARGSRLLTFHSNVKQTKASNNPGSPVKQQFHPPPPISSYWRLSSTETACGALSVFSSVLVCAKSSKAFFG